MNDKDFIACIIILILLFNFCKAEEKISLDVVIKEAKENNPEIKMLQNKYLAAVQKITAVKAWEYPQLGVETNGSEQMYFIYQMLPFPGKLSLRGKVAEYESKIIEQELNSKIREVVAMVKKTYWNYWLINKIIEIYHENIDLMKRFLNIANTQYAIGKVTQTDVLKANTEVALMENMLVMLEQEKVSTQAELNALLNRPAETPLGRPEKPEQKEIKYTYEEIENIALRNCPEIKAKEYLYQKNISALSLSKREWYPDIMAGLKIDNMFNRTFMAQISVPLYYKKQSSIIEMSKKEKDMSATKISTLKQLKNLWSKYESIKKSVLTYETIILPLAKQTLEIAEASYRVGKNNFLDLLDSQRKYLDYNINYYKLITEKEVILAELEQVVGVELK
jgi:outer membrane protein TolC